MCSCRVILYANLIQTFWMRNWYCFQFIDTFWNHKVKTKSHPKAVARKKNIEAMSMKTVSISKLYELNSVRRVVEANCAQISCCASEKVPAHTRGCVAATCPWNTSRQLFHKCANAAIWSLLHVPMTQPWNISRQSVLNAILSPRHFAAKCSCNMSPRVGPPLRAFMMTKDNKNENHCLSKCLGLPVWLLAAALLIIINHSTDSLDYYLFVLDGLDMSLLY